MREIIKHKKFPPVVMQICFVSKLGSIPSVGIKVQLLTVNLRPFAILVRCGQRAKTLQWTLQCEKLHLTQTRVLAGTLCGRFFFFFFFFELHSCRHSPLFCQEPRRLGAGLWAVFATKLMQLFHCMWLSNFALPLSARSATQAYWFVSVLYSLCGFLAWQTKFLRDICSWTFETVNTFKATYIRRLSQQHKHSFQLCTECLSYLPAIKTLTSEL